MIPLALAAQGGGMLLNNVGQHQALGAMQQVWQDAMRRNQGFDDQINSAAGNLVAGVTPDSLTGASQTRNTAQLLDRSDRTLAAALRGRMGRGARDLSTLRPGSLATTLRAGRTSAQLQAQAAGLDGRHAAIANLMRIFGGERQRVGQRSREWEALMPTLLDAAGHEGAGWREAGNMLNMGGQALGSWDMNQPTNEAPDHYAVADTTRPGRPVFNPHQSLTPAWGG